VFEGVSGLVVADILCTGGAFVYALDPPRPITTPAASGLIFRKLLFSGEGLRALFGSPHLEKLAWLDLGRCNLDEAAMGGLDSCPEGLRPTHLDL